jgi:hypothetical protein
MTTHTVIPDIHADMDRLNASLEQASTSAEAQRLAAERWEDYQRRQ